MAVYKVPQDVEADDKLLGPFSFRQFIYLIIVAMAIGIGYVLSQIFIGLAVLVVPVVIFFGALALPLKKDQPMEAYLGALISFYFLKPRKRFWQPDGLNALVEITAPKTAEPELTKNLSEQEARERLSYLSDIVESQGWAVRGSGVSTQGLASLPQTQDDSDLLGNDNAEAQRFNQMLDTRDEQGMSQLRSNFQQGMSAPPPPPTQEPQPQVQYNPYPAIHQSVVEPASTQSQPQATPQPQIQTTTPVPQQTTPPETTSVNSPSPDIIRLANESGDISVASVAEQAHRLEKQHGLPEDEVEISLH